MVATILPLGASAQVVITKQPANQSVATGARLTLTIQATGNGPLTYQWRRNGVNIPGSNNPTLTVANFQPSDSGDYSVAVSDAAGALDSAVAKIRENYPDVLPFTDSMKGQNRINGAVGTGVGNNARATREPGEPFHANKHGSNSVWVSWQAPLLGLLPTEATFDTAGSSFDTLLAVYTGSSVSNLTLVAANDDDFSCNDSTRAFHTSRVRFNPKPGTIYYIAVDGLEGATGDITLNWRASLVEGLLSILNILPTINVGLPGDDLTLSVNVQGLLVSYQWYQNCEPIPGETKNILQILNLQPSKVGNYNVLVRDLLTGEEVISDPIDVQINVVDGRTLGLSTINKFSEAADLAVSSQVATPRLQKSAAKTSAVRKSAGGPARGYRGSQVFSTVGATKDPGEPNHCGEAGGASVWYSYQSPADGLIDIDTEGSDFDTVLAIYTGPGTDFSSLVSVACDNDSGPDGRTSKVTFQATKDTVYYIAVDGVGGASGTAHLNYDFGSAPVITQQPDTQTVPPGGNVTLVVGVSGIPSPTFQWQFCPAEIPCATNASVVLTNFQAADQGDYLVAVSNFAGTTVSARATLLLDSPLRLDSFRLASNVFRMRLIGPRNGTFVIQASSNLQDWTSLGTNTAPSGIWEYLDSGGVHPGRCFYRAIAAP